MCVHQLYFFPGWFVWKFSQLRVKAARQSFISYTHVLNVSEQTNKQTNKTRVRTFSLLHSNGMVYFVLVRICVYLQANIYPFWAVTIVKNSGDIWLNLKLTLYSIAMHHLWYSIYLAYHHRWFDTGVFEHLFLPFPPPNIPSGLYTIGNCKLMVIFVYSIHDDYYQGKSNE